MRGASDAVAPGGDVARAADAPERAEGRVRRAADAPDRAEGRVRRAADAVTEGPDAWAGRLRRAVRDGLSGSGSHGSESAPPAAPPAPAQEPAPPVVSAPPNPPAAQASSPTTPPAAQAPAPVPPAVPQGSVPPRRPGAPAEEAPEADPAPVRPVLPGRPVAPRPVVRPLPEPEEAEGEPCPNCGTLNPPDRRFCRRCAAPLNPAPARAALPWWRTIWPFRRRVRAGSGRFKRLLVILLVVAVLAVGVFFALPAGRGLFEDTKDKLDGAKSIRPTHATASAQIPGHPAANTLDGLNNRYWAAPSAGATITYTFAKPIRLVDVIITNGASTTLKQYQAEGRALTIDLDTTSSNGTTHHQELTLDDRPGDQTFTTGVSDVTTARLTLRAPAGLTKGHHLALAEVEFFRRG
ncbi:NADase-type glycan-binding domain-containing protein [Streptomyces sp. NPDC021020]|uniref:NADase-type glycan-binding domain-containing protein n=1 Tax=Streptomyces sp. NPDC021020 TaxID=3365109 RepID=UPI0037954AAA